MQGHVYILVNSSLPNLVKIGRTTKSPEARAQELSGTGTPGRFVVAYSVMVDDCVAVEGEMHSSFVSKRHSSDREFFDVTATDAINKLIVLSKDRIISTPTSENLNSDKFKPASFYVIQVSEKLPICRVGMMYEPETYLWKDSFTDFLMDFYRTSWPEGVYSRKTVGIHGFHDIDATHYEKMQSAMDDWLKNYKYKHSNLYIDYPYDVRTLAIRGTTVGTKFWEDTRIPGAIFNEVVELLTPIALQSQKLAVSQTQMLAEERRAAKIAAFRRAGL